MGGATSRPTSLHGIECPPTAHDALTPLFVDGAKWQSAELVAVKPPPSHAATRAVWEALDVYETCYKIHPPKAHVPTLRSSVALEPEHFEKHFQAVGQPLLVHPRHLNFK